MTTCHEQSVHAIIRLFVFEHLPGKIVICKCEEKLCSRFALMQVDYDCRDYHCVIKFIYCNFSCFAVSLLAMTTMVFEWVDTLAQFHFLFAQYAQSNFNTFLSAKPFSHVVAGTVHV